MDKLIKRVWRLDHDELLPIDILRAINGLILMESILKQNKCLGLADCEFRVLSDEHWRLNCSRQNTFKVHRSTESILLRFRKGFSDDKPPNQDESQVLCDYPLMELYRGQVEQYLSLLSRFYSFRDYAVIVARLLPESSIAMHVDRGMYFEKSYRIHIPIKTSKNAYFVVDRKIFNMVLSGVYEVNNTGCRHGVFNKSAFPRDHLIFDLFP